MLILVVLASRLPFIMHGLDEWDSANFALSLIHFDVLDHQPHPPGQFFYVCLMRFLNLFSGNELFTLSLGSALCSTLALVPYYLTLRQMFRPAVAMGATVLTAFTFGFWITSLRMISDPVGCLFVYGTVCVLLAGVTSGRWFVLGMALCGAALGVKQTAVYFLAPFVIVVNLVVLFRHGLRRPLAGSVCFAVVVGAWLLPTVSNCGGWTKYIAVCRALQHENYALESLIFQFTPLAAKIQAQHNLIQPWGTAALAVVMLALAAVGLFVCLRRGLRGSLFTLFALSVALYSFFFLYRFNKYFVYSVPLYCAFAAAALFAIGAWLARLTQRPMAGQAVPALGIALITAVNVGLTAPLLPAIAHFRAPPQSALENLRKMPGVEAVPLIFADSPAPDRELYYFHLKNKVQLLNPDKDLHAAVAALNAGRKVYVLSQVAPDPHPDQGSTARLVGRYDWRPDLYEPLQGRWDLQALSLYEMSYPLPLAYTFEHLKSRPPMLQIGLGEDGWCGVGARFLLPCEETGSEMVRFRGTVPDKFGYHFPYQVVCQFSNGHRETLDLTHAGPFDFVAPLPDHPGAHAMEALFLVSQISHPSQHDPTLANHGDLSVHLDSVDCVTASHPLSLERENGWYAPETDGKSQWRWTDGDAALGVLVDQAGALVISGAARSVSNDNAVEMLVDGRPVEVLPLPGAGWEPMAWRLPVTAGSHQITLHSRNPGVQPPGDGRRLAVCVRDLQVKFEP